MTSVARLCVCILVSLLAVACTRGGEACAEGGTVTTSSGLIYTDIACGDGTEVRRGDTILVHYTGTLEDGTEFDSSRGGEPLTIAIDSGNVIDGWVEGIPGMREGGRRELEIPSDLAYGDAGRPPTIPPGATLIFDVEIVEVVED